MRFSKKVAWGLATNLGITIYAWAQGMGQAPQIPGEFKPVVGSGAQYEITMKGQAKMGWAYAVVGKEVVKGAEGYWLEIRTEGGKDEGLIMKQLVVTQAGLPEIERMIMQAPGQPPMEMPAGMMSGMMKRGREGTVSAEGGLGQKLGTESLTVPAGTFLTDHYRTQTGKTSADVWISSKVSPYGLVKMTSAEGTMVLVKVLQNETSRIKGTPQKMDIAMPKF